MLLGWTSFTFTIVFHGLYFFLGDCEVFALSNARRAILFRKHTAKGYRIVFPTHYWSSYHTLAMLTWIIKAIFCTSTQTLNPCLLLFFPNTGCSVELHRPTVCSDRPFLIYREDLLNDERIGSEISSKRTEFQNAKMGRGLLYMLRFTGCSFPATCARVSLYHGKDRGGLITRQTTFCAVSSWIFHIPDPAFSTDKQRSIFKRHENDLSDMSWWISTRGYQVTCDVLEDKVFSKYNA